MIRNFGSTTNSVARRMRASLGVALVAAAFVGALPNEAHAFCRTTTCRPEKDPDNCRKDEHGCATKGNPLIWPTSCVSFAMDTALTRFLPPELTTPAIATAFGSWQDAMCPNGQKPSITFGTPKTPVSCSEPQALPNGPNVNIVFFRDDFWPYRGIDGTLASTTVTYDADGTIWDADMAINAAENILTTSNDKVSYDLQSIVLHEAGHFIGLNHSDDGEAVMYASYSPGSVSRKLQADDIAALCAVYPSTRTAACDPRSRGGTATSCEAVPVADESCATTPATGATSVFAVCSASVLALTLACLRRRTRSPIRR